MSEEKPFDVKQYVGNLNAIDQAAQRVRHDINSKGGVLPLAEDLLKQMQDPAQRHEGSISAYGKAAAGVISSLAEEVKDQTALLRKTISLSPVDEDTKKRLNKQADTAVADAGSYEQYASFIRAEVALIETEKRELDGLKTLELPQEKSKAIGIEDHSGEGVKVDGFLTPEKLIKHVQAGLEAHNNKSIEYAKTLEEKLASSQGRDAALSNLAEAIALKSYMAQENRNESSQGKKVLKNGKEKLLKGDALSGAKEVGVASEKLGAAVEYSVADNALGKAIGDTKKSFSISNDDIKKAIGGGQRADVLLRRAVLSGQSHEPPAR